MEHQKKKKKKKKYMISNKIAERIIIFSKILQQNKLID